MESALDCNLLFVATDSLGILSSLLTEMNQRMNQIELLEIAELFPVLLLGSHLMFLLSYLLCLVFGILRHKA